MTDKERNRRFAKERTARARAKNRIQRETAKEIDRLLKRAAREITADLASQPTDFARWQLPIILRAIERARAELADGLATAGADGMRRSWAAGIDLIDKPVAAGGVAIGALLPDVDVGQLSAMRAFTTDRLRDVSRAAIAKINSEIGLVVIGAQPPAEAVAKVAGLVKGGRGRAITIVRTELGRAFATATQARQEQAAEILPGLKKQWRRSGKIHSRFAHDLADGQIVGVDESFTVNGIKLKFPRDPAGPAKETINCGCTTLPFMESWEVRQPGRQPFSAQEVRLNPRKRDLADALRS